MHIQGWFSEVVAPGVLVAPEASPLIPVRVLAAVGVDLCLGWKSKSFLMAS